MVVPPFERYPQNAANPNLLPIGLQFGFAAFWFGPQERSLLPVEPFNKKAVGNSLRVAHRKLGAVDGT